MRFDRRVAGCVSSLAPLTPFFLPHTLSFGVPAESDDEEEIEDTVASMMLAKLGKRKASSSSSSSSSRSNKARTGKGTRVEVEYEDDDDAEYERERAREQAAAVSSMDFNF